MLRLVVLVLAAVAGLVTPFVTRKLPHSLPRSSIFYCAPSDTADVDSDYFSSTTRTLADIQKVKMKMELLAYSASSDRGFGATSGDRSKIDALVASLKSLSASAPTPISADPTYGLYPGNATSNTVANLEGVWRMVYTDAYDVLSLAASPLTLLQGIYQVIKSNGRSVNVIDLTSRLIPLLPVPLAGSLESVLRLKVFTQAKARSSSRVGLRFFGLKAEPLSFLGQRNLPFLPPLSTDLPQKFLYELVDSVLGKGARGESSTAVEEVDDNLPGFFDVEYLDEDMLIIRQNQPGGIFISAKLQVSASEFEEYF